MMLKLKLQYFGHLMGRVDSLEKTLMLGGIGSRKKGDDRGWDGWMVSLTRWTWVWVNSRSWCWTGRPGVLGFMGSQRVGHDWATELNWRLCDLKFQLCSLLINVCWHLLLIIILYISLKYLEENLILEFLWGQVEGKPKQWILMLWYEPFSGWKPFCVIWYFCYRIGGEIDDTEVEETQEEKIKWKVKLECEQMPKKVRLSWCIEKNRQERVWEIN